MANESIASVQDLVAAREAKGMSVEDVQRQLKLHPRQVRAIEEGDWDALPGMPFVRGTLRNYGKLIGVDVAPLIESIVGQGKPAELRPSSSLEEPLHASGMLGFGNGGSGNPWIWISLLLVGFVALALYFGRDGDVSKIPSWFGSPGKPSASEPAPAADASPGRRSDPVAIPSLPQASSDGKAPSEPASPGTGAASQAVPAPSAPAAAPGVPAPAAPAASATAAAGAAADLKAPAGNVERVSLAPDAASGDTVPLQITFDAESWIEIRSATGKVLFTGTPKPNQTTIYATRGPISLVVARPEKVKIEYDGKPVSSKPPSGAAILKLKLPQP